MKGYIHSFESLAALDGTGLRYGVFFSGCPLSCVCCHNPDARITAGTEFSAEELVRKICRYRPYFGSDGGVTFSGGEPLMQASFIREMIPLLEQNNINYAIDTAGSATIDDDVAAVLDNAQLVLLDMKFPDEESYKKYTGIGILNTIRTAEYLKKANKRTWIRTVIIPGINDTEDVVSKYIPLIKKHTNAERYELLAFHTMGFFKYENLGIENPLKGVLPLSPDILTRLQKHVDSALY